MSEEKNKKDRKESEELEKPSYTYWKRESDIIADHSGFQPLKASEIPQQKKNFLGSAWNQGGTWEEKRILKQPLETFFNDYIKKINRS